MSAYNVLAIAGGPRTTEYLQAFLQERPSFDRLEAALWELMRRGRIRSSSYGWDVLDAKRRIVRTRDLSDAETIGDEQRGGWEGWIVQCAQRGMLRIEDAIAESRRGNEVGA